MKTRPILITLALAAACTAIFLTAKKTPPPAPPAASREETPVKADSAPPLARTSVAANHDQGAKMDKAVPAPATAASPVLAQDSTGSRPAFSSPAPSNGSGPVAPAIPRETLPPENGAALLVPGRMVTAEVTVNGVNHDLTPNQVGSFPRVYVDPRQMVTVVATWPEGQAGQRVVAAVEDGGQLNGNQRVLALNLDSANRAAFEFTAGKDPGIYRVALRSGADVKMLELWAGPELALKQP